MTSVNEYLFRSVDSKQTEVSGEAIGSVYAEW